MLTWHVNFARAQQGIFLECLIWDSRSLWGCPQDCPIACRSDGGLAFCMVTQMKYGFTCISVRLGQKLTHSIIIQCMNEWILTFSSVPSETKLLQLDPGSSPFLKQVGNVGQSRGSGDGCCGRPKKQMLFMGDRAVHAGNGERRRKREGGRATEERRGVLYFLCRPDLESGLR